MHGKGSGWLKVENYQQFFYVFAPLKEASRSLFSFFHPLISSPHNHKPGLLHLFHLWPQSCSFHAMNKNSIDDDIFMGLE